MHIVSQAEEGRGSRRSGRAVEPQLWPRHERCGKGGAAGSGGKSCRLCRDGRRCRSVGDAARARRVPKSSRRRGGCAAYAGYWALGSGTRTPLLHPTARVHRASMCVIAGSQGQSPDVVGSCGCTGLVALLWPPRLESHSVPAVRAARGQLDVSEVHADIRLATDAGAGHAQRVVSG